MSCSMPSSYVTGEKLSLGGAGEYDETAVRTPPSMSQRKGPKPLPAETEPGL